MNKPDKRFDPSFRWARGADAPAIHVLVESAYRGDASRIGWTTEAGILNGQRVDAASITEMIEKPDSEILLGESDRQLLACAHLEKQADACYFGMFAVRPHLQGGGIGGTTLVEAERIAREKWQCVHMQMTVITIRTDLIPWYERRGYRRTGAFKPFPYGDERFGIPRRDDLRFEWLRKTL